MAGSLDVEALELFDPAPEDPTVHGLAAAVIAAARKFNQPIALVAHGTAVPVAWRAAQALQPAALVLSDGPVSRLDGVLGGLCQLARSPWLFSKTVLQPDFLTRWLASSAGLRRAVVNPYVADRDTVVALLAPLLRSPEHRLAVARFLRSLPQAVVSPTPYEGRTLLCWGDADPLYGPEIADEARRWLPQADVVAVPGGQHLHPLERPWAMADLVVQWLTERAIAT